MNFTINELRQLVIQELATIGDAKGAAFGEKDEGELSAAALGTVQQKIAELEDKIKDIARAMEALKTAQRTSKEQEEKKETGSCRRNNRHPRW